MIGDGPQLLTHYYDDARTMYEVFRRGLSISGERGHGGVEGLWQGLSRCKGVGEQAWFQGYGRRVTPRFRGEKPFLALLPPRQVAAL